MSDTNSQNNTSNGGYNDSPGVDNGLTDSQKNILSSIKRLSKVRIQEEEYVVNIIKKLSEDSSLTKKDIERRTIEVIGAMRENQISRLSKYEQVEARKTRLKDLEEERKNLAEKHNAHMAYLEVTDASDEEKRRAQEEAHADELAFMHAQQQELAKINDLERQKREEEKAYAKSTSVGTVGKKVLSNIKDEGTLKGSGALLGSLSKLPGQLKSTLENNAKFTKEQAERSKKEAELLQSEYESRLENGESADSDEMKELLKRGQEAQIKATKDANKASMAAFASAIESSITNEYKRAFKEATDILTQYKGKIDARMQGTSKDFEDLQNTISNNLSLSPFVKTTKVLEKLSEAVDQGISYNIEQRAFLASITDKIVSTFDAFDSNLLRLIKLQQADSTAARMGMEASLNKLFNNMFQDTSYLSDGFDQVSAAILDANSQLSRDASAEFEFVVQKWLGALSSLGMDTNTLTTIAQGINYLATGDVTNLSNNSSLQTMLAMAASNANLEYSEMLLNGMDADTTNKLLESMIIYLKDIAENSDSQVVKAAYGDIFNMSLSDMSAISNLTSKEITTLANHNMTYGNMMSEMNTQLNQLVSRSSIAEMLSNVYDNVMFSVASDMAGNPATFMMQKMVDYMTDTGTDINIPFINAMGFGLDLNASVKDLMQMGLGISQAFSLAGTLASALGSDFGTELGSPWKATETTQRGAGLNLTSASTLGGVSGSLGTFAQSGNSEDVTNSTMSSATDDAEESKKITNKNSEPPKYDIEDLYTAIVGDSASSYVNIKDSTLLAAYDPPLNSLRAYDPRLTVESGRTKDAILLKAYNENYGLKVYDSGISDTLKGGLATTDTVLSGISDKANGLKTYDNRLKFNGSGENSKLQVYDSNSSTTLESISTLISTESTSTKTVALGEGATVIVDKANVEEAMKSAMFGDVKDDSATLQDVLNMLKGGTLKVLGITEDVKVVSGTTKLNVSNLVW